MHRLYIGMRHCIELCVLGLELFPFQANEGSLVTHLIAVVWCAENCDALSTVSLLITTLFDLVRTNEKIEIVV